MTLLRPTLKLVPLTLLLAACGATTTPTTVKSFDVVLRATTDEGQPMPGAQFGVGATTLGATDASGTAKATIHGEDGQTVAISTSCPEGYVAPEKPTSLRLALVRKIDDTGPVVLGVESVCTRKMRDVVLVVRTKNAPSLNVDIGGRTVGHTDENGVAHFGLQLDRDVRSLSVSLKTSAWSSLRPQNPSRVFELDGHDAVLLLDQAFAAEQKVVRVVKRLPPPPESKHVPYKID